MSEDQTNTTAFEDRRFRLLIDAVVDYAIYMIDPDGIIISWNAGARRFKGYEEAEIIGQHFSRFYTDDDRGVGKPQKALDTAIREGRFEGEGWRVRKDGTHFWSHVVIDPIYDPSGQLLGFAKITRDLTDRKMAQQALEKTREALFQAQKMQAIGQLSGGIAHDFNNLLTVILGNLEIVRKRISDDPKITRLLDNATQGALRGVSLTQRMLAFARRQELKSEPVEIPALVQGISGLLRSSLGPSVVLETRFPAELEPVLADVNQLELAVLNLATNARDAMPHGGKIVISTRTEDVCDDIRPPMAAGRYVCLSVTDTGEGMDDATLASAMDPFFTTKGLGKGTGLGLSMVHGFIEQLGGRFVLKSKKDHGTTAELWLPVANSNAPPDVVIDEPVTPQVPRLSVLVVDDDSLVLTSTCLLLEDLGHRVIAATSGVQALEMLAGDQVIDLVITDMAMPQMSGAQLADAIRRLKPHMPIILASGYAERLESFEAGLPRLSKPFTQLNLVEIIASTMK
ncbi:PAS domain S-box protein [Pseudomonas sp. TNT2022 ID1044]|uniref:PAS domain S-box protein n=1 Tax=Pseudomonas sp. TNT2022 ID1044 TaxID=2942636 RepID=UPI00235E23D5|nr:PAS domain S-box protein [Pseudomonas sp. TNT2022 ID1044]MDD0995041.1 PAS domain S-box protein [Pseudomonas sp. TNT2022 ID1044]